MNAMRKTGVLLAAVIACALAGVARAEDISASGWRLWLDKDAQWKDDTLYLPSEVDLEKMPANAPTGGWGALSDSAGISVSLPTTVEEHYWGKLGLRPYAQNEAQAGPRTNGQNGNYLGVSWWYRPVQVPQLKPGQRLKVTFRGARLRAEVYCNGKLVGYTIMTELPFEADLTDAVKPGETAQLAVRITNAGGNLDWIDFGASRFRWGKYMFPPSHGFGGLDRDIKLEVRDAVSVSDVAAINTPDLKRVHLLAEVKNAGSAPYDGPVKLSVSRGADAVWTGEARVSLAAGEVREVGIDAVVEGAEPWDVSHPNLYAARAEIPGMDASARSVDFGFRFFTAEGIGSEDAKLTFNGKRFFMMSAISWGYWGKNGLWPTGELARREVADAKELGLNCLSFHRNIGKPEVLDLQDKMGLLRVEEPGAGKFFIGDRYARGPFDADGNMPDVKGDEGNDRLHAAKDYVQPDKVDTSGDGPDGDGKRFWEKYTEEKILRMVRRDRSHPSLVMYTMQNESSDVNLNNPRIYRIFREIHGLDPGRVIAMYSGGVPKDAQVLMLPYGDEIRYGSKTVEFAGWRDVHSCGGPTNYTDVLYQDPQHFSQLSPEKNHNAICVWGEDLGAAAPDDFERIVNTFGPEQNGYELTDMRAANDGYKAFLDKWGFRKAFPTESDLYHAVGHRMYYFWQRIIAQARMDNFNDGLVVSGWESTSIDNHSGIVDNHRFFKGDPKLIAKSTRPELLFLQPRHMIVRKGEKDLVDAYLINQTGRSGEHVLKVVARRPDGTVAATIEKKVIAKGGDTYGQLLAAAIEVPAEQGGMLKLEATLAPASAGQAALSGSDEIEVLDVEGAPIFRDIAVSESGSEITKTLADTFGVRAVKFSEAPAGHLDAVVLSSKSMRRALSGPDDKPAADVAGKTGKKEDFGPQVTVADFDAALARVKNDGTRLVLWPDHDVAAQVFAKALADRKIVTFSGVSGNRNAPWFGSWNFVRKHWLLDGLPTDCAMDWRYGTSAFAGPEWLRDEPKGTRHDGLMLDAPGMEVFAGYGADHSPRVGVAGCAIPYGKGKIVLYCLPQLTRGLVPGNFAISAPVAQRMLGNALRPSSEE